MSAHDQKADLGTMCTSGNHRVCGGWWCTCECHDDVDFSTAPRNADHVDHPYWEQVDGCVYCCGVRLYRGRVPVDRAGRVAMAKMLDDLHDEAVVRWAAMRLDVEAARAAS